MLTGAGEGHGVGSATKCVVKVGSATKCVLNVGSATKCRKGR